MAKHSLEQPAQLVRRLLRVRVVADQRPLEADAPIRALDVVPARVEQLGDGEALVDRH